MIDLADLKAEHFEDLLGQDLPIADSGFVFTLRSVDRLKSPSPRGQPFSLTLLAPPDARGGQGIYHLVHPTLGVLEVFLVPIAPAEGRAQFEAIFN